MTRTFSEYILQEVPMNNWLYVWIGSYLVFMATEVMNYDVRVLLIIGGISFVSMIMYANEIKQTKHNSLLEVPEK